MNCKCGNESVGRDLISYYKRKDGTVTKYVQKEKRCQKCIDKSKRKKQKYIRYDDPKNYAY